MNQVEVRARLLQRHAGLEPTVAAVPEVETAEHERLVDRRYEEIHVAIRKAERRWQDSHDRHRLIADAHAALEHLRVGLEPRRPITMADQYGRRRPRLILRGCKSAAYLRPRAPDLEETWRHVRQAILFGQIAGGLGHVLAVVTGEGLERAALRVPFLQANRRGVADRRIGARLVHDDQSIGARERQRLQQDRVDRGEHRAVRADAKRQGQDHDDRESRRPAQRPQGVARVPQQAVKGEYAAMGAARVGGAHARCVATTRPRVGGQRNERRRGLYARQRPDLVPKMGTQVPLRGRRCAAEYASRAGFPPTPPVVP